MINILINEMAKKKKNELQKNRTGNGLPYSQIMKMIADETQLKNLYRNRPQITAGQENRLTIYKRFFNYLKKRHLEKTARNIKRTYFKQ